jgi:hypothetical protein
MRENEKPSDLRRTVTVQTTFGSEFQRDVAMKNFKAALHAWEESVEAGHKNNKVTITET